jgi:hypothetical protein
LLKKVTKSNLSLEPLDMIGYIKTLGPKCIMSAVVWSNEAMTLDTSVTRWKLATFKGGTTVLEDENDTEQTGEHRRTEKLNWFPPNPPMCMMEVADVPTKLVVQVVQML